METDQSQLHSLLAREQRAPRYTSYPTAMEFSNNFTVNQYTQALARTNDEPVPAPLSLYVHIPFCASACFYCGCNRTISCNAQRHEQYLDALMREIELQGSLVAPDRLVKQIHFGGGTPNILRPRKIAQILNKLLRHFRFDDQCEISLEVDPRQYQPRDAEAWALMGFNRISLGIQDTDPRVQKLINRRQNETGIKSLVDEARRAGIESINFDLICGLPGQSPDSFASTLAFVEKVRPERIAVFHYAHMPNRFPAQRAIHDEDLPSLATTFEIQAKTRQHLLACGYDHIGMDHFALPQDQLAQARRDGRLRRNFQGYTVLGDCDLIGMGVSAISQVGDCIAQNQSDLKAYEKSLEHGTLPVFRGLNKHFDDRVRAAIIEKIMCQGVVNFADFERSWSVSIPDCYAEELSKLERLDPESNWVQRSPHDIKVTSAGQQFLRLISQCFDAHAENQATRAQRAGNVRKAR